MTLVKSFIHGTFSLQNQHAQEFQDTTVMAASKSASTQRYFFVVEKDALCWVQPLQLLALCPVALPIQSMFTCLVLSS